MPQREHKQAIQLGDLHIEVVRKSIKHVHLSVHPPLGQVKMSAPERMQLDTLRAYAISRLLWIRQQQRKISEQEREAPRDYVDRESHYLWGKRYLLTVLEQDVPPQVLKKTNALVLRVRPGSSVKNRADVMAGWYREQLRTVLPALIKKWEPVIGVKIERCFIQHMKTRWGSCNPSAATIRLNTELAKKPKECLEYILAHEMVHMLEPSHNERFVSLMNLVMPDWQHRRNRLNRLPVRHEEWVY